MTTRTRRKEPRYLRVCRAALRRIEDDRDRLRDQAGQNLHEAPGKAPQPARPSTGRSPEAPTHRTASMADPRTTFLRATHQFHPPYTPIPLSGVVFRVSHVFFTRFWLRLSLGHFWMKAEICGSQE